MPLGGAIAAELAGRVLPGAPVPRIACGVGVAKRVGMEGFIVGTGATVLVAEPGPEGTPVAIVTMPGAERAVALAAPAGVAPAVPVALPEAGEVAVPPPDPVAATARVGLGAAPIGVVVAGAGVSVAVATVQAERIALNAAPAAPLRSMRRENRVGLVSSTKESSLCKHRDAKQLRPRHIARR